MDENITCSNCSKTFTARQNYYRHLKKFHPAVKIDYCRANIQCPVCDERFPFMSSLHDHIMKSHTDVNLKFEDLTFYSEEDFIKWKTETEYESVSRFIAKHGPSEVNQQGKKHFYCHRSGSENIKSKRKRKLKKGGSNKIGFTCPAYIAVTERKEGDVEIKVKYQATHYGHLNDITRIALSREERSHLAWKMSLGVPKSRILKDIASFSSKEKLSYLNNTDLNNIIRDFKIENEITRQAVSKKERSNKASKMKGVSKPRILKAVVSSFSATERVPYLTNTDLNNIMSNFQIEGNQATHYVHKNEIARPQKEGSNVSSKMSTICDFSCSCPDYAIKNLICEHIHQVAEHYEIGPLTQDHLVDDVDDSLDRKQILINPLVDEKESVRGKVMDLLNNIMQKCKSPDLTSYELKMWNDCLNNVIQEVEQKKSALKMKSEQVLQEEI